VAVTLPAADLDALESRVTQRVLERFETAVSPWMQIDQAADYLAWPKKRLYNLVAGKEIPHHKVGNRLLFHREELDRWLADFYDGPAGYST
jgi:excisionase family DNA binding protein